MRQTGHGSNGVRVYKRQQDKEVSSILQPPGIIAQTVRRSEKQKAWKTYKERL